eukprot:766613-Hanusia_phi.AAC.3
MNATDGFHIICSNALRASRTITNKYKDPFLDHHRPPLSSAPAHCTHAKGPWGPVNRRSVSQREDGVVVEGREGKERAQ